MEIFVDGDKVEAEGEFVEDGTETHFQVSGLPCYVLTSSILQKGGKLQHALFVNEEEIQPVVAEERTSEVGWEK